MNKREFTEALEKMNLPREHFIILSGGSLLMRGLREQTEDLDITVSKELARKIDLYHCPQDDHGLYMPFENVQMMDDMDRFRFDMVDGYRCESLEDILRQKKEWNREKDQRDIEVIEQALREREERLHRQMAFSLEIDKEKNVFRQTHLSGHGRNENDAEHAWHMAIMAYLFREYANEPVDITKVMLMCLIHDIVEIDAGDTYAYDEEMLKTQKEREEKAKERIFSLLPEDQKEELTALFDEFEDYQTPEAKFAHSLDNFQPLILNNGNGGSDWEEHGVSSQTVYGRQTKTRLGSEILYEATDRILQEHIRKGSLREQNPDQRST